MPKIETGDHPTEPRHSRGYEYSIVALLLLFWGIVGLTRVGLGAIFPYIVPEFHMAYWQAGLLVSGTSITWAFSSWIGGWLSDRFGRRKLLLPAAGLTALTTAAMGGAWSFLSMFVVRDLMGIGEGVGWSVGEAVTHEESAPHRRAMNQGIFTAGYTLIGAGVGIIFITRLSHVIGWRWVFVIIGIAAAIISVLLALIMREPAKREQTETIDWHMAVRLLKNRSILILTIIGCVILAWLQVNIAFNMLFLTHIRHFTIVEGGAILSAWGIAGAVGQLIIPKISDYLGRRVTIAICALIATVMMALYLIAGFGEFGMLLLQGIGGFFAWGHLPVSIATCVSENSSERERATALGITNFFAVIFGTSVMPVVGGIVADHLGLTTAMWIPVVSQAVVALLIFAVAETAPRVLARRGMVAVAAE